MCVFEIIYARIANVNHTSWSIRMTFGEILKYFRKLRKKTQQQMADLLGVKLRTYQSYELDEREPSIKALVALADALDVPLDYLLGRKGAPPFPQLATEEIRSDGSHEDIEAKILSAFPKRLCECREVKGFSQKEMASAVKVALRNWQKYESGESLPGYGRLVKIADCLGVSVDYLLRRKNTP